MFMRLSPATAAALSALLGLCLPACAFGNPTGGVVIQGNATFNPPGNGMSAPGSITNWQSFAIQKNEVTRFISSGSGSPTLNRVTGDNPARILGTLQSNPPVQLLNPNGIVLEAKDGAIVDVQGSSRLAPGQSMTLTDSKNPDLKIEVTAPAHRAIDVGQVMGTAGAKGAVAALFQRDGTREAASAVLGPNGRIILQAAPAPAPALP
jgi:filamentous hemagglutinin family protein